MNNILSLFKILNFKEKINIFFLILLGCVAAILETLSVASILPVITSIVDTEKEYSLFSYSTNNLDFKSIITFFCIMIIIKNLYFIFFSYFNIYIIDKIYSNLCNKILKNNLNKEYLNFNKIHSGEFIRNLYSFTKAFRDFLVSIINLIIEIIILISLLTLLLVYDHLLTLQGLLIIGIFFCIYYFLVRSKIDYFSSVRFNEETNINKILLSIFHGFIEITLNNSKKYFGKIFLNRISKYIESVRFIQFYSLTPRFILEFFLVLILLIVFYMKGFNENQVLTSLPTFGLYIYAGYRILPSLNRINNYIMAIKSVKIALKYVYKEIPTTTTSIDNSNIKIIKEIDKIRFKNLNYIYPGSKKKVFKKNVNLTFEVGCIYGLLGTSGSGKSTLCKIISGLINDYQGSYYLNNKLIKKNFFKLNRIDLSYISQKPYFLDIDLYKNITQDFNSNVKNMKKYRHALKLSRSQSFLTQKKINYKTILRENASSLSGGQKQRLSIAKIFYKSSKVIILDEATNALDKKNETSIIKTLKMKYKNSIVIIISHNESLLNYCDKIIKI